MSDDHFSLDELAELDAGLLDPERASAARSHLGDCEQCRARAGAITATRAMLADLPTVTMPVDVAARLDQALAAAAAASAEVVVAATTEAPTRAPAVADSEPVEELEDLEDGVRPNNVTPIDTDVRSADVVPRSASVTTPRFGRPAAAGMAAAAVLVLGLGAVIVGHFTHGSSPTQTAATAPNAAHGLINPAPSSNFTQTSTGLTYTTANLQKDIPGLIARSTAGASSPLPATTPTAGSLGTTNAGAGGGSAKASGGSAAKSQDSTERPTHLTDQPVPKPLRALANSRTKLLQCAALITGEAGAVPLTVDFGRWTSPPFTRAPSAFFVFAGSSASTVTVYVTGPTCSGEVPIRNVTVVTLPD